MPPSKEGTNLIARQDCPATINILLSYTQSVSIWVIGKDVLGAQVVGCSEGEVQCGGSLFRVGEVNCGEFRIRILLFWYTVQQINLYKILLRFRIGI